MNEWVSEWVQAKARTSIKNNNVFRLTSECANIKNWRIFVVVQSKRAPTMCFHNSLSLYIIIIIFWLLLFSSHLISLKSIWTYRNESEWKRMNVHPVRKKNNNKTVDNYQLHNERKKNAINIICEYELSECECEGFR